MLGYRSYFTASVPEGTGQDVVPLVLGQVHAWLRGKGYEPDRVTAGSVVDIGAGAEASLSEEHADDGSESVLFTLREKNGTGTWVTQIVVHDPHRARKKAWVWLDIDGPEQARTAVPRVARSLLDVLDARDGGARLDARVRTVGSDDVGQLVTALRDDSRRGPVFVAGSDDSLPLHPWRELVGDLLKQTTGLAAGYLLDPDATKEFAHLVGPTHSVMPGTMRTFVRGIVIGDEIDARRHRILTTQRILTDGRRMIGMLGVRARHLTLAQPVPHAAVRVEERLLRRADEDFYASLGRARNAQRPALVRDHDSVRPGAAEFESGMASIIDDEATVTESSARLAPATEAPDAGAEAQPNPTGASAPSVVPEQVVADDVDAFLALRTVLKEVLGAEEVTADAVLELGSKAEAEADLRSLLKRKEMYAATLNDTIGALREEHAETERRLDDEMAEHAQTAVDLERVTGELHALRIRLQQEGNAELAWKALVSAESMRAPNSFSDLLERLATLENVVWTGADDVALALEASDTMGTWAGKTWQVLLALNDYARVSKAGSFHGSVEHFLTTTPPGCYGFSANRHAQNESEDVRTTARYREKRLLRVPSTIDPSGRVFMGAHFKIAQFGMISPRLHYYDAVAKDGTVYVGYIGPHLPTQQTN